MSELAEEVVKVLGRRRIENRLQLEVSEVDKLLDGLGIPTSASRGVPVHLRVARVSFSGTKRLDPAHPDAQGFPLEEMGGDPVEQFELELDEGDGPAEGEDGGIDDARRPKEDSVEEDGSEGRVLRSLVPFSFTWEPLDGVNGIGSGNNLRGKSSIVELLLWSLSGRCGVFSGTVRRWIEHVQVDWVVGGETLRIEFDADAGEVSNGSVTRLGDGSGNLVVAQFADDDAFEDAMNSIMLSRLRLETFTV